MCLIDNSHLNGLYQWNPLQELTVRKICVCGWGGPGPCPCPNNPVWRTETATVPSNWKPRIRVKAISKHW